jgi:ferrous iron transport protein A
MRLNELPSRHAATIASIDWPALRPGRGAADARARLRRGRPHRDAASRPVGADPIACRVGRMTIAMRRATASAVSVEPVPLAAE